MDEDNELDLYTLFIYSVHNTYNPDSLKEVLAQYGKDKRFFCNEKNSKIAYAVYAYEDTIMAKNALLAFQNSSQFKFKAVYAKKNKKSPNILKNSSTNKPFDFKSENEISLKNNSPNKDCHQNSKYHQKSSPKQMDDTFLEYGKNKKNIFEWIENQISQCAEKSWCQCVKCNDDVNACDVRLTSDNRVTYEIELDKCHLCNKLIIYKSHDKLESAQTENSSQFKCVFCLNNHTYTVSPLFLNTMHFKKLQHVTVN